MDGAATINWLQNHGVRDFDLGDSSLGLNVSYKREAGANQDAPFAVIYPRYWKWTVTLTLPRKGSGFILIDADDVDKTAAGVEFKRHSRIADGVVTMEATVQSLAPEFPAAEADSASATLRDLYKTDVVVRDASPPAESVSATDYKTYVVRNASRPAESVSTADYHTNLVARDVSPLVGSVSTTDAAAKQVLEASTAIQNGDIETGLAEIRPRPPRRPSPIYHRTSADRATAFSPGRPFRPRITNSRWGPRNKPPRWPARAASIGRSGCSRPWRRATPTKAPRA